ncbi:MAG: hypothetical protein IJZ66_03295 [Oscillibacter sp.]|nr:hypothetical protein [Oscillibacter sp.]
MKKLLCGLLAAGVLVLFLLPRSSGNTGMDTRSLSSTLGVDVRAGTVLEESDTHGGFHGDGLTYTALSFAGNSLSGQLSSSWSPLPLSPHLTSLAYGSGTAAIRSGPYLTDGNGAPVLPAVENGYYYFYDRHDRAEDPRDESAVMGRSSFNLTLALYDTDTDMLYYVEYDT